MPWLSIGHNELFVNFYSRADDATNINDHLAYGATGLTPTFTDIKAGGSSNSVDMGQSTGNTFDRVDASYAGTSQLGTGFWLPAVFAAAAAAVADGGLLAWEAYTDDARRTRRGLPPEWCLAPGEPASLLPPEFSVLDQSEIPLS